MRYAETGYFLEIDLSTGNIEKIESDPTWLELYIGGQGTADRILWERVPPEVEPFSAENLLIFSAGLLCGTPIPGANRTIVNTFSPQTNLHAHSMMGSYFAAEMKFAGYDKIIFKGKADKLVYVVIYNDKVEIRDASHLKGLGTTDTQEVLKKELGKEFQIAAIGPAGENRVFYASIDHSHSSAARGVGAVMGDKKIKAIAIRGTKDVYVANPEKVFEIANRLRKEIAENPHVGDWMATDEDDSFHHDNFAWGNARVRRKGYWTPEIQERFTRLKYEHLDRQTGCFNCPKRCHNVISWPNRKRFSYKCFGKDTYHMAAFQELDFSYDILGVAQNLGLDSYTTPQVIAFALELYEAGILTDNDLPGMPNDVKGRFFYFLDKIVKREGIGDVLAEGVYWAARKIGRGAEAYDHNTTKKFEQVPIKLGKLNPPYFLMIATGEKMNITQIEGSFPQDPLPTREQREEFVKGWVAAKDERFKKWFLEWEKRERVTIEMACAITEWNEAMHYIDDATGLCGFVSSFRGQFGGRTVYHIHNIPYFLTLVTGVEFDEDKLWKVYKRNRNLVRALNVRRGMRREDEKPPDDHWAVRNPEYEKILLDCYYEYQGWTVDGIPTVETLKNLNLDFVAEDFLKRGILKGNDEVPKVYEKYKDKYPWGI